VESLDGRDVAIGQLAPDFIPDCENGNKDTPDDFRGEIVVLMFYPFGRSGLCATEQIPHAARRRAA